MKSGTAIEHAVNSVVTESVNIHNHSEVIQRVNYGFSCWQAYHLRFSWSCSTEHSKHCRPVRVALRTLPWSGRLDARPSQGNRGGSAR